MLEQAFGLNTGMGGGVGMSAALHAVPHSQPNGEFVCVARGLLFEGNILAQGPASNEAEWVPVRGTAEDLCQGGEASAKELSNMVPLDSAEEAQRLDRCGEQRSESRGESGA